MPTDAFVIAATETLIIEAEIDRTLLVLQNNDAANACRVSDTAQGGATGINLIAGAYLEMNQCLGWNTERSYGVYSLAGISELIVLRGYGKQTITIRQEGAPLTPTSPLQEPNRPDPVM